MPHPIQGAGDGGLHLADSSRRRDRSSCSGYYFEGNTKRIGFLEGMDIILEEMRATHEILGLSNQRRKKIGSWVLDTWGLGYLLDVHFEGTGRQVAVPVCSLGDQSGQEV